ncbi:MAG: histidine kinase [Gammaproteobacteria bacterium]|nr:histidine kinase [Gammaproteobacteria bacterium]
MQPSPGQVVQAGEGGAPGEFFIPDLCAPRTVFVMVLLVELMVLVYTLTASDLPNFDWETLALCSLFVQWVVLLSASVLCGLRRIISGFGLALASVYCLLVVVGITAISSFAAWHLLPFFNDGTGVGWWLLRNLLVAVVLGGIVLRYFYLQQQLVVQKQLELQSRLDALRARIRPHFLFNTLNSIASLIVSRPQDAERAVEDLAELLRVSLQEQQRPTQVADELRLCELYLSIERLRLGERLQVRWEVDPALRETPMPSLTLQPLVENAVYHGVAQLTAGGTIVISVRREAGAVQVVVENPAPGKSSRTDGHHMALENIRQRLLVLYGSQGQLRILQAGGLFRVELNYPLQEGV